MSLRYRKEILGGARAVEVKKAVNVDQEVMRSHQHYGLSRVSLWLPALFEFHCDRAAALLWERRAFTDDICVQMTYDIHVIVTLLQDKQACTFRVPVSLCGLSARKQNT